MWRDIVSTISIISGLLILTLAVYGMLKMPDIYTRLHAASKAAFLGILPFLLAASLSGEPATITRSLLIALFLLLTTPVSAHVIGQTAYLASKRVETAELIDNIEQERPNA